jgi:glycine cleavage system H lipoate-binding protein
VVPEQLRYTAEHEWVAAGDDGQVRVGITHYAQDALGDIVFLQLPETGAQFAAGEGWLLELAPSDPEPLQGLLDAAGYRKLTDA